MDRVNKVTTHDGVSLRLVYEVMWHMISGAIQAGGVVGKLGGTGGLHPSAIGPTADVLWFVGLELEYEGATESSSPLSPAPKGGHEDSPGWLRLCDFVRAAAKRIPLVPKKILLERLELSLLGGADIVNSESFKRRLVRMNTKKFYQQEKFNLLREETEGYSKLIGELLALTCFGPGSPGVGAAVHTMKSLIGYFHLDPNRAFDLVLDAYEQCLDDALLLGNGYAVLPHASTNCAPNSAEDSEDMGAAFSRAVAMFPRLMEIFRIQKLAPLLGAKFRRFVGAAVPGSLYRLAAVVMAQGLVALDDILPYLEPDDEEQEEKSGKGHVGTGDTSHSETALNPARRCTASQRDGLRSLADVCKNRSAQLIQFARGYGVVSLSRKRTCVSNSSEAAFLASEMGLCCVPAAVLAADKQFQCNQGDQHLGLLKGVLQCGSWSQAVSYMRRMTSVGASIPSISALHAGCASALGSVLHVALDALYKPLSPRRLRLRGNALGRGKSDHAARAIALSGVWQEEYGTAIREWNIFPSALLSLTRYAGYSVLARDPMLLTKLCRVMRDLTKHRPDMVTHDDEQVSLLRVLGETVLPAVGLLSFPSPGHANDLWSAIKHLPYYFRYKVFENWREITYETKNPDLFIAQASAKHEIRAYMKRASAEKDRCRMVGRQLAKVAHGNPVPSLECIVAQVERYDNLIQPVVDSLKYMSRLSLDVVAYIFVHRLGGSGRVRLKGDGVNLSHWLTSLSSFVGSFFHKYPDTELDGILHFLIGRLREKRSLELIVLKEVLAKMSGIEVLDVGLVSDEQLMGMAGGPKSILRTLSLALIKRVQGSTRASTARLKSALLSGNQLALPLLLFIAQQRTSILYEMRASHLKLVGNLHDMCQDTLMQLAEYLSTWVTPLARYAALLPNLSDMHCKYHLQPDVIFHLARPAMSGALRANHLLFLGKPMGPSTSTTKCRPDTDTNLSEALVQWHPHNPALRTSVRKLMPDEVWDCLSPAFYLTFWSLRLRDVFVPRVNYTQELRRVVERSRKLDKESSASAHAGTYGLTPEMRRERRAVEKKRRSERAILTKREELLEKEQHQHAAHFEGVLKILEAEKASWFPTDKSGALGGNLETAMRQRTVNEFIQRCVLPRVLFSAEDALFCAKFVDVLHALGAPYFNTLQYFDKVMRQMTVTVFCVTEREAVCLGVFLKQTLSTLTRWCQDGGVYATEAARAGFGLSLDGSDLSFGLFQKIMQGWEGKLLRVFGVAMQSSEWMEVRNAILILNKILPVFPNSADGFCKLLAIAGSLEKEQRHDLKQMGKSYLKKLSKRKDKVWPKAPKASSVPSTPPAHCGSKSGQQKNRPIDSVSDTEPIDNGVLGNRRKGGVRKGASRAHGRVAAAEDRRQRGEDGTRDRTKRRGDRDRRLRKRELERSEAGAASNASNGASRRESGKDYGGGSNNRPRSHAHNKGRDNNTADSQHVPAKRSASVPRKPGSSQAPKGAAHHPRKGCGDGRRSASGEAGRESNSLHARRDQGHVRTVSRDRRHRGRERTRDRSKPEEGRERIRKSSNTTHDGGASRDSTSSSSIRRRRHDDDRSDRHGGRGKRASADGRGKGRGKGHKRGRDGDSDRREHKREHKRRRS